VQACREDEVFARGELAIDECRMSDVADLGAQCASREEGACAFTMRFEAAGARAREAGEDAEQCALSGTIRAENRDRFARFDVEVDASKRADASETLFDPCTMQQDRIQLSSSCVGYKFPPQCEQKRQFAVTALPQVGQ